MTIAALTGHRPPKTGLTYSHSSPVDNATVDRVRQFILTYPIDQLIVGGAQGFDTLGARAAWLEGIPYNVYVPFKGQPSAWPAKAQERYRTMLDLAHSVKIITGGGYSAFKMQERNVAMIDDADLLATWWDGSSGGTHNTIRYAEALSRKIIHLYPGNTS